MKRRLFRARTVRSRALLVTAVVALAPLAFVWSTDLGDAAFRERVRWTVGHAQASAMEAVREERDDEALSHRLDSVAWTWGVRIAVVAPDGTVRVDADHDERLSARLGELLGSEGPRAADAHPSPTVFAREASAGARAERCAELAGHGALLCESAAQTPAGDTLVVQRAAPRDLRTLYDARTPLLKLTLFVMALAMFLGWWLGRAWVSPIELLRQQVQARVDRPLTAPPIANYRDDEFGDLAEAFDTLLAAVRDSAAANERYVADLAHEMKNPVAAVRAAAESLSRGQAVDEARAERLGRVLAQSSQRLDELVTGLLELARAEAGLVGQERAQVNLGELVQGLATALAESERFPGVRFAVERQGDTVAAVAPGPVEAALNNLLQNAASFAGDDGEVHVRVATEAAGVRVEITDSGAGIAPEALPRVFERFFTQRASAGGTGLGLALVRAVAEAHGGTATVTSPPGAGACFVFFVPRAFPVDR